MLDLDYQKYEMPNTFSKLYIHHVSAVKYRNGLILPEIEDRLFKYITKIIQGLDQTLIQINGMTDHIHIAARLRPSMAPAVFVQKVKSNSSKWINENSILNQEFAWQTGGGSFSINESDMPKLITYIKNQKQHHRTITFEEEYIDLLEKNGIKPTSEYLPEFFNSIY